MSTTLEKNTKPSPVEKSSNSKESDEVSKARKKSCHQSNINCFSYNTYIYRVLKQVHPDTGISGAALATMVNLVKVTASMIMLAANQIIMRNGTKTIDGRVIQSAVKLALPGELAKHAVTEGTKAVEKYSLNKGEAESTEKGKKKQRTRTMRAGITFNVSRVEKLMMLECTAQRKGALAAVYLAAVLEYVTADLLRLSGDIARDFNRIRITPRHIKLSILNDYEFNHLYFNTIIGGGVKMPKESEPRKPRKQTKPKVEEVAEEVKPKVKKAKNKPVASKKSKGSKGSETSLPKKTAKTSKKKMATAPLKKKVKAK